MSPRLKATTLAATALLQNSFLPSSNPTNSSAQPQSGIPPVAVVASTKPRKGSKKGPKTAPKAPEPTQSRGIDVLPLDAYKARAQAQLVRRQQDEDGGRPLTFKEFVSLVSPRYQWYWHCDELAKTLEKVVSGEINRLMVFMPPRHGKSETTSRLFTAYFLYRYPEKWVALCSYASSLANTLSRATKDNFLAAGGDLRGDAKAVQHWYTAQGGGMWATGVGGPATGKGFHLGVIDDPLKNAEQARSEVIRAKHKEWYASTFYTREEPGGGAIVVVQTRWHEGDLAGSLLEQEIGNDDPERWHIVNMPAIKDEVDPGFPPSCTVIPDTRVTGQPLCPERYTLKKLLKIAATVGEYVWNALYQQRPSAQDGNLFKAEMFCQPDDKGEINGHVFWPYPDCAVLEAYLSFDTATKEKRVNDFTAGCLVLYCVDGYYYLVPLILERKETPKVQKIMAVAWAQWKQILGDALVSCRLETNSAGIAIAQNIRLMVTQRKTHDKPPSRLWTQSEWDLVRKAPRIILHEYTSTGAAGDKTERAHKVLPFCAGQNVRLVKTALSRRWLEMLMSFPLSNHDDAVDASVAGMEPFLVEEDETGITTSDKLAKVLRKS